MEFIKTNDTVRFGVVTSNASGDISAADSTPRWSVFEQATDTPILLGDFTVRTGFAGVYRGTFDATAANGFDANSYYEIHASGAVGGIEGRSIIKAFVLDDTYNANIVQVTGIPITPTTAIDANVIQVTGDPITSTDISEYHAPPSGMWGHPIGVFVSGELNPIYYATTKFVKDYKTNSQDEYTMSWYRNNQPVTSGDITNPALSVYETTSNATIIANQTLDYIGTQGILRHSETTAANIAKSGEPYMMFASGVIDGSNRVWRQAVGIDLL